MRAKPKNSIREMKIEFIQRLAQVLITTRDQPEIGPTLGGNWISPKLFAANTKILAHTLHITRNALCYDFRTHGFQKESTRSYRDQIKALGTPKDCRIYSYEGLNQMTIETVLGQIHYQKPDGTVKGQRIEQIETAPKPDEMDHEEVRLDEPDLMPFHEEVPQGVFDLMSLNEAPFPNDFDLMPFHEEVPQGVFDLMLLNEAPFPNDFDLMPFHEEVPQGVFDLMSLNEAVFQDDFDLMPLHEDEGDLHPNENPEGQRIEQIETAPKPDEMDHEEIIAPDGNNPSAVNIATNTGVQGSLWDGLDPNRVHEDDWGQGSDWGHFDF